MPAAGDVALRFRAKLFGRPVDEAIVKRGEEALPAPLAILEDHLTHNRWIMGAGFGLVDCAYCPILNVIEKSDFSLARFPRVAAISTRVALARAGSRRPGSLACSRRNGGWPSLRLTLRGCYLGSYISYNAKKMVENEYLAHERSVHDRRSVHVRLTEKGIKLRDSLSAMHRRHVEMLPGAAVSADDLQSAGATLRRLERFWMRATDLMQRPQPLAPVSSPPARPLFA